LLKTLSIYFFVRITTVKVDSKCIFYKSISMFIVFEMSSSQYVSSNIKPIELFCIYYNIKFQMVVEIMIAWDCESRWGCYGIFSLCIKLVVVKFHCLELMGYQRRQCFVKPNHYGSWRSIMAVKSVDGFFSCEIGIR